MSSSSRRPTAGKLTPRPRSSPEPLTRVCPFPTGRKTPALEKNPRSSSPWRSPPWSVCTACTTTFSSSSHVSQSCLQPSLQSAALQPESLLPLESMRESQSLELEPSVSMATPAEAERAATMPAEAARAQLVLQEGLLGRKHDVEGSGKRASNRSAQTPSANHRELKPPPTHRGQSHCPLSPSSCPQVLEQPVLRPESGSALGLQGRQEFGPWRDLSRRGAPEPGQRQLGGPQQLQEEEARLQAAVSVHVSAIAGMQPRTEALWSSRPLAGCSASTHSHPALLCLQPRRRQRVLVPVQR